MTQKQIEDYAERMTELIANNIDIADEGADYWRKAMSGRHERHRDRYSPHVLHAETWVDALIYFRRNAKAILTEVINADDS